MTQKKRSRKTEIDIAAIIDTALALASANGWKNVTIEDIAVRLDAPVDKVRSLTPSRFTILKALGRQIDANVASAASGGSNGTVRDRLFDLLMERFDSLNARRDGVLAIARSTRCDPRDAMRSLPYLRHSMASTLEAAGESASGIAGHMKIAGLTGLYLKVFKEWMRDESDDLSATMAALDKSLGQADELARTLRFHV